MEFTHDTNPNIKNIPARIVSDMKYCFCLQEFGIPFLFYKYDSFVSIIED